jgi:hypothetical protein
MRSWLEPSQPWDQMCVTSHRGMTAKASSIVHNFLLPSFGHLIHVVMDSFQATKISRSSSVCCVLGSKESSVGRKHDQLTADDGTHSHM